MLKQAFVILRKNLLCTFRNKCDFLKELLIPLISGIVIYSTKSMEFFFMLMVPIYLPMAIMGFTRKLIINFVNEKSEKYKEYQKIMGVNSTSYTLGWIFTSYITGFLCAIIVLAIILPTDVSEFLNKGEVTLLYFLYALSITHQTFAITTFFSTPKIAAEVAGLIMTLPSFLFLFMFYTEQKTSTLFYLISLFPQPALSFGILSMHPLFQAFFQNVFSPQKAMMMLLLDSIIYLSLYFYLDEVFPNEYGVKKHPLFCLDFIFPCLSNNPPESYNTNSRSWCPCLKRKNETLLYNNPNTVQIELSDPVQIERIQSQPNMISSAIYHEEILGENNLQSSIEIKNLTKKFGKLLAVNGVSMKLFPDQILCLLGHNGAGKTTLINLLTGIFEQTAGSITISGLSIPQHLDQIRKSIGFCCQKDILYEEMTVEEHLRFICEIKELSPELISSEIEYIIDRVGLSTERKKLTNQLSGGNKRKLSLGMSLISGSKVIFLDEPTSGMDPISRRMIWDILKSIKGDGRTIILTTHHLDEADIIADRIAVLSNGKLLTLGTSDFIKRTFGVGYVLKINPLEGYSLDQFNQIKIICEKIIKELIPSTYKNVQQCSKECDTYIIPFTAQNKFTNLFENLENLQKNSPFNMSMEMNSLEDAFINIGMENAPIIVSNPPECLKKGSEYNFFAQLQAIFLRKYYMTVRSWNTMLMFCFPIIFILIGVILGKAITNEKDISEGVKLFFVSVFIVQGYCFNSSVYITLPVYEREQKLKYALNVMGCRGLPYWIGTFLFDFLSYLLTFSLFIIFVVILNLEFVTPHLMKITFIMFFYGFALIVFSYACGFLFNKANSAHKTFPLINYFLLYSVPWILLGLLSAFETASKIVQIFSYIISPFFVVDRALASISNTTFLPNELLTNHISFCFILIGQFFLYAIITCYCERKSKYFKYENSQIQNQSNTNHNFINLNEVFENQLDEDIIKEEQRVSDYQTKDPIKISRLQKTYENGFQALKGVSFGVEKKQIFGLLGPNGAGKSTTFNIISALIPRSNGDIYLKNKAISSSIFQDVGICPQFDCLWDHLTPKEHLLLFGRLKGLKGIDLNDSVNYFISVMQLDNFIKTKAKNLSGGNKRKLCVSNALIGGPDLQFFDEPSTGLDPIAKRYLWNTLQNSLECRNSSIVLTTHSMMEAEFLCHKIGILINGKFVCLGSNQHLKNKYGDGYRIRIKLLIGNSEEINNLILNKFPLAKNFIENQSDYLCYQMPMKNFSFYQVFEFLEDNLKFNKKIDNFSITLGSLEQIFIYFSKFQHNNEV